MIDKRTVFEIYRLRDERLSIREISSRMQLSRQTVRRYLSDPRVIRKKVEKPSKLDPFKFQIEQWLQSNPKLKVTLIFQRLNGLGFNGKYGIVKQYVRNIRPKATPLPIRRFESRPGEQFQIDWGVFGVLKYGSSQRNLYAMVVIEGYSRKLSVIFTHSTDQHTFHQALLAAFRYFEGTPKELVFDNMKTAVTERVGSLIRFNEAFLDFLRPFHIVPKACAPKLPRSKGKVERIIRYIRDNFWPLREFENLNDVQSQMNEWLQNIANVRLHQTTQQTPNQRFRTDSLQPLPSFLPDCSHTRSVSVLADATITFDSNYYSVPDWSLGHRLMVKANQYHVSVFIKERRIAHHLRCWQHKQLIENPKHRKNRTQKIRSLPDPDCVYFVSLDPCCETFLSGLNQSGLPLRKSISQLLKLLDEYGIDSLISAIQKAIHYKVYGVDYIKNILYQEKRPISLQPPVVLQNDEFNQIRLQPPSLAEYDAISIKKNREES